MNRVDSGRYYILDDIRGITLLSMIAYHAVWDLVYMFGFDWQWYRSDGAYIWQQSICWTFIFLSGFCQPLGRRKLRRGTTVFFAGLLISAVTYIITPEIRILFGVLTLIGSCMLLMIPADRLLRQCNPIAGIAIAMTLFFLTKNLRQGCLGFESWKFYEIPTEWYCNYVTTYLGLPFPGFFSSDYYPLFPWIFLFAAGYFLYRLFERKDLLHGLKKRGVRPLEWIGRHTLGIYIIHQPALYLLFLLLLPQ